MRIIRYSFYNLLGLGLPLLVAVFSIPVLIRELGEARFGLLTLIWAIVSYLSLFDLGLGRALTQQLAVVLEGKNRERAGAMVATAMAIMTFFGVVAGILLAVAGPWALGWIKAVPDRGEAVNAIWIMALVMPAVVATSGLRGVLEARHAFAVVNAIRLPMGLLTFLGPLAVVWAGVPRLDAITLVLALGRVMTCMLHAWYARRALGADAGKWEFDRSLVRPLCTTGGWMTVSNVVSPLMSYADRFIVGAVLSSAAVAYYVTPQELITKLSILPNALTAVLFPTLAAQLIKRDGAATALVRRATFWIYLALLPITAAFALFSRELLTIWVGADFAMQSYGVLQIFAAGMFITCLAQIPFTVLQGAGRANVTAAAHLVEAPFFMVALWVLCHAYGVTGAAIAWLLRVAVDAVIMFWGARTTLAASLLGSSPGQAVLAGLLSVSAFAGLLIPGLAARGAWLGGLSVILLWAWLRSLARARR